MTTDDLITQAVTHGVEAALISHRLAKGEDAPATQSQLGQEMEEHKTAYKATLGQLRDLDPEQYEKIHNDVTVRVRGQLVEKLSPK